MDSCDVLVVGGGPAGSTCGWKLKKAGLDVLLLDKQNFPRDKPCAGWITPAVMQSLEIDTGEYSRGQVLQEFRNFRTGIIHGTEMLTSFDKAVSYGIRRFEFDDYLLRRSDVRKMLGEPVVQLQRREGGWLVNRHIEARMVVGAGGHFCPAARFLGAKVGSEKAVVARVAECAMSPEQERRCGIPGDTPQLSFCRDMKGYGWIMRKGRYLNVGLGRLDRNHLPRHAEEYFNFLETRRDMPPGVNGRFVGHAYLLYERQGRRLVDDGVLLAGDAAGLSYQQSGEGILPAVESGLMAAQVILEADGDYSRNKLEPYAAKLAARFDSGNGENLDFLLPSGVRRFIGARLLGSRWFTRSVLLDRWFLHADLKAL